MSNTPTDRPTGRHRAAVAWGITAVAACTIAYLPITNGYFFADDFFDLFALGNGSVRRFLLTSGGGHLELLRNVVFFSWWTAFGHEPAGYFWTVLALHAAVVATVYVAARRCTGRPSTAGVVALLFGTCRTSADTLAWLSVAGQVLATLLVATTMVDIASQTLRGRSMTFRRTAGWTGLLFAASLCFGSGTAVAVTFPVMLLVLFPSGRRRRAPVALATVMTVAVLAIWIGSVLLVVLGDDSTPRPDVHPLFRSSGAIAMAFLHLLGAGTAGLVLGPWYEYTRYPNAMAFVAATAFFTTLGIALRCGQGPARRLLVSLIVLTCSVYGVTAIARAPVLRALSPRLAMATVASQPRYHYLSHVLLALELAVALGILAGRFRRFDRGLAGASSMVAVALLAAVWWNPPPVDLHTAQRQATREGMAAIEGVTARYPRGSVVYLLNRNWNHGLGLWLVPEQLPGIAALYIAFTAEDEIDGRAVRFLATSEKQLLARSWGGRIARLLVPPRPGVHVDDVGGPRWGAEPQGGEMPRRYPR